MNKNIKIIIEYELTARQADILPKNIAKLLHVACDKEVGTILQDLAQQELDFEKQEIIGLAKINQQ
jgi:hypothetical protein